MIAPAVSIHLDEDTGRWLADPADRLSVAVAEAWNVEAEPVPAKSCCVDAGAALLLHRRHPEFAEAMGVNLTHWNTAR